MKKVDFDKVVSESLQRLHYTLEKKIQKLNPQDYAGYMPYMAFLKQVAAEPRKYCVPGDEFTKNAKELSFFVSTKYPLVNVDKNVAQNVYDIMECMSDYILYDDKKSSGIRALKYNSQQDAINAMDILRRDCVHFTGGTIPYVAWKLFGRAK